MDVEAGDADTVELGGILQIADGKLEMVVQVVLILPKTGVAGRGLEADGVAPHRIIQFLGTHQHGELIELQMDAVLTLNELPHPLELLPTDTHGAHGGAVRVLPGPQIERSRSDRVSAEPIAQALAVALDLLLGRGGARRQVVVLERDLRLATFHQIDVDGNLLPVLVLLRRNAWEQDGAERLLPLAKDAARLLLAELIRAEEGRLPIVGNDVHPVLLHLIHLLRDNGSLLLLLCPGLERTGHGIGPLADEQEDHGDGRRKESTLCRRRHCYISCLVIAAAPINTTQLSTFAARTVGIRITEPASRSRYRQWFVFLAAAAERGAAAGHRRPLHVVINEVKTSEEESHHLVKCGSFHRKYFDKNGILRV